MVPVEELQPGKKIGPTTRSGVPNDAVGNHLKSAYSTFVPCAPTQTPLTSHCFKNVGKRLPSAHPSGLAFHLSTLSARIFAGNQRENQSTSAGLRFE